MNSASSGQPLRSRLADRILNAVGSVPFGVTILVLILLWCWIGSAGTAPFGSWFIRQSFEKTEMEWFSWWPFRILLVLLVVSVVLVTLRKIPFSMPKLGVWTVHAGIVVLCVGGWIYFGRKVEGDVAVFRRAAVFQVDGGRQVSLRLQEGASTQVPAPSGDYQVSVVSLNSGYELLTGDDKGKKAYAVQLMVTPPHGSADSAPFIRQLLAGYPEYTEDVVPGQGRAIKVLGRRLVDERFQATLDYASSDRMYLVDRPALQARFEGEEDWTEYSLRGLPRYHEHLARTSDAVLRPGEQPRKVRSLNLRPKPAKGTPGLADLSFRVTGYLPAAVLRESWEAGGETHRPIVRFTVDLGENSSQHTLLSDDPTAGRVTLAQDLDATFRTVEDSAELDHLLHPGSPQLVARISGAGKSETIPLGDIMEGEAPLPGTGYRLQIQRYVPRWTLGDGGGTASMALVHVEGNGKEFVRAVFAPQSDRSRDFDPNGHLLTELIDPELDLTLENVVEPGLMLVGAPDGLHVLLTSGDGSVLHEPAPVGEAVSLMGGALCVTVDEYSETSRPSDQPEVIPVAERDPKAGLAFSLVQLEITHGGDTQRVWMEYSHYAFTNRFGYHPRRITLAGLPTLELLYSRETLKLPAPVALEDFRLETYPGGTRDREYESVIRFQENGRWSEPRHVRTNNPTQLAGWWFFQSTWDPPEPSSGYAGMNYTGLGVGNRHGVSLLFLGGMMIVLGTAWAFYVKPVLLRRRAARMVEERERVPAASQPRTAATVAARTFLPFLLLLPSLLPGLLSGLLPVLLSVLLPAGPARAAALPPAAQAQTSSLSGFATALDLSVIRLAAVQEDGRIKTFDSLAREKMRLVNARLARTVDPVYWYLDTMLSPAEGSDLPAIRIAKPAFRHRLVQTIRSIVPAEERTGTVSSAELNRIDHDGLISRAFLDHPAVRTALAHLEPDLLGTGKEVRKLEDAWLLTNSDMLSGIWRVVPVSDDPQDLWLNPLDVFHRSLSGSNMINDAESTEGMASMADPHVTDAVLTADDSPSTVAASPADAPSADDAHSANDAHSDDDAPAIGRTHSAGDADSKDAAFSIIAKEWQDLRESWANRDAARASASLGRLAHAFRQAAPAAYPPERRLSWEHWYYRHDKLTQVWLIYFFAIPFLLMAWVYGFRWARVTGLSLYGLGFALHTFSIALRWWLAGRIPNSNMFEAITASAWFGGAIALVLEVLLRRWPLKNLPALAASTYAMLVMMAGHFIPIMLPTALDNSIGTVMPVLDRTIWLYIHTNIVIASYALIFCGSVTALLYLALRTATSMAPTSRLALLWGGGYVKGGAGSILVGRGLTPGEAGESGLARTLDGATMVFLELAFIALFLGTILGAVWADVSWGRPWGWDPKEVFALNTWLVFLVLVHVRLKVKDKGLWTALLAVVGCAVMLFNWIAVNFVIVGLHSYA